MKIETWRLVTIIVCLTILGSGGYQALLPLSSIGRGYTTGYQGAKAQFCGIQYNGKNHKNALWSTTLNWDPDGIGKGKPGITGEMTSVFVPEEEAGSQPFKLGDWDISDWLLSATTIRNPIDDWEWELKNQKTNETLLYRMEEWQCKWYFSISSEPVGWGQEIPEAKIGGRRNSLTDVKVWFEFDLTPIWYFEGTDTAYFAIAKLRISDIALGGKLKNDDIEEKKNAAFRVTPMSPQSILPIYYEKFATEDERAEKEPHYYNGKKLNPRLFTDKVYSYFTLNDFGVNSWFDFGGYYRSDVITVGVDFHIFVVGEWRVKDVQEIPDEYGRTAKSTRGMGLLEFLGTILKDPTTKAWIILGLIALIFLVLAIFAPWVLLAIFGLVKGISKERGR